MFGSSSSSQYLHPDYISPLPTTLDAKNSPLALLAQTCSSIGHDLGPTKHSPDKKSSKENRSGSSGSNTSCSVEEKKATPERNRTSGSSIPDRQSSSSKSHNSVANNNNNNKSTSVQNNSNKSGSNKPSVSQRKEVLSPISRDSLADKHSSRSTSSLGHRDKDRAGVGSPMAGSGVYSSSHSDRRSASPKQNSLRSSSPIAVPPCFTGAEPPFLYPPPGALSQLPGAYSFPFDLFSYSAAAAAAASVAAAQNAAAVAAAGKYPASLMSSYLSGYSRTGLVPSEAQIASIEACKDPYCTHCTLSGRASSDDRPTICPHLGSSCPQCNRSKSIGASSSSVSSGAPSGAPHSPTAACLPGLPSLYPGSSLLYPGSPFGSLFPGGMLGSLPTYVCPVMLPGVGELCGKRCSNSEEFIQHLRTHTPPYSEPSLLNGSSYPTASQLALSSLSQRSLAGRSFYPLLDSLGPSASALRPSSYSHPGVGHSALLSSRFHPYKPPLVGADLSSGLSSYAASAQALEAYRTLHAQRALGAIAP